MRRSEARQSNELVVERSCLEARVGVRDNDDESVSEKLASWLCHSLTPEFQHGVMLARYDNYRTANKSLGIFLNSNSTFEV